MANYVFIAASIDGYIADAAGGLGWLTGLPNPGGADYGYGEFLARIDAIVMGRATFETVRSFPEWPYEKPVVVLSRSLGSLEGGLPPPRDPGRPVHAELMAGEPRAIAEALGRRGWANLYIDGGRTIQEFLAADAVDELTVTRVSVILGGGTPLFGALGAPLAFDLVGTRDWGPDLQSATYRRRRAAPGPGRA